MTAGACAGQAASARVLCDVLTKEYPMRRRFATYFTVAAAIMIVLMAAAFAALQS
jgi:hypothetical protein